MKRLNIIRGCHHLLDKGNFVTLRNSHADGSRHCDRKRIISDIAFYELQKIAQALYNLCTVPLVFLADNTTARSFEQYHFYGR